MTITEATALHRLLRCTIIDGDGADDAVDAAAHLADRAHAALGAGVTGDQIRDLYAEESLW